MALIKQRKLNIFLLSVAVLLGLTLIFFLYGLFTTSGSKLLTKLVLSNYFGLKEVSIARVNGTLSRGFELEDVEIKSIPLLSKDSSLKIQRLDIYVRPFKFDSINLGMENCRLILPYSEPIVLFADYKKVKLDVNVYSRRIDVGEILSLFSKNSNFKDVSGAIANVDSAISGSFTKPQVTGVFEVEKLTYKEVSLLNCPGSFAVDFKGKTKDSGPQGAVVLQGGSLVVKGIKVSMQESRILFLPAFKEPLFDFRGVIDRDDAKIKMVVRGSLSNPVLRLNSEPAQPENLLLYLLLKGKRLDENKYFVATAVSLGPKLSKDVLDYFLFGADANTIITSLGVSESPLQFEPPAVATPPQGALPLTPSN